MLATYRKVENYWRRNPIWMPFLLLLFFAFTLVSRHLELRNALFGTHIDIAHPRTVRGIFEKHGSTFAPYELHSMSGSTVRVSCQAHERFALCLDGKPVFRRVVDVTYVPASGALLNRSEGIVTTVAEEGRIIATNDPASVAHVYSVQASVLTHFLQVMIWGCVFLLALIAIFLAIGVATSIRRLLGDQSPSELIDR